jgi:ankyrin repeat protein
VRLGDEELIMLCDALIAGDTAKLQELDKKGVNVNSRFGEVSSSVLMKAPTSLLTLLIKAGADVDAQDDRGLTALMMVSEDGYLEAARILIRARANPNLQDITGRTALSYASRSPRLLDLLLRSGANPNIADKSGTTPLIFASVANQKEAVALLLKAGADPNRRRLDGGTALSGAKRANGKDVIDLLHRYGARKNSAAQSLTEAAYVGQRQLVERYLSDTSARKPEELGWALVLACERGHVDVEGMLISAGADVNFMPTPYVTPLMSAIKKNQTEAVRLLIENRVEVNFMEKFTGSRPLLLAAGTGQLEVVRLLIKAGADVNATDDTGGTAIKAAMDNHHQEVIEVLRKAGAKEWHNKGE